MKARTPYEKGMSACRRGKRMHDNPYTHETTRQSANNREWKRGYAEQAKIEADEAQLQAKLSGAPD